MSRNLVAAGDLHESPVELLQRLLRFDTTNPPGSERACLEWLAGLLQDAGLQTTFVAAEPARPSLVARLRGSGDAPPLLLEVHVDVVSTAGQRWAHPPFAGEIVDGYVWGRGALEMKGGVAMFVAAALRAAATGLAPAGHVVLALVSDEEAGGDLGAAHLVACKQLPHLFPYIPKQPGYNKRLRALAPRVPDGMPIGLCPAPANEPEREVAAAMLERARRAGLLTGGEVVVGDKGFAGEEFEQIVAAFDATLIRPDRKGEKPRFGKLGGIRQCIESIYQTTKSQLSLELHGARIPAGVCARVCQRVLALAAGDVISQWPASAGR